jgi:hypothetical protein
VDDGEGEEDDVVDVYIARSSVHLRNGPYDFSAIDGTFDGNNKQNKQTTPARDHEQLNSRDHATGGNRTEFSVVPRFPRVKLFQPGVTARLQ